ncbi:MAG TPA: M56 family metallopeptidase [Pirellulales bacterium]|nr:M56 family metallopeptidase [Pirellulales bacterium]
MSSPWVALAERVGIALVHSLWQGALVGLALLLGLVALRRARGQVRYLACCLALVTTLLLPVCTFFAVRADRVEIGTVDNLPRGGATFVASAAAALEAAVSLLPEEFSGDATEQRSPPRADMESTAPDKSSIEGPAAAAPPWLSPRAEHLLLAIVAAWSIGVILLSCRVLGGYVVAWRLTRRLVAPLDDAWQVRFRRLAARLGIERPIELWQSAAIEVPAVIGCFRPVILLPIGMLTGLPVAQVESILAHELAHVRRHDFLVNAAQSVVEILLFYHPCVWWISARIRAEREHCCDETAVAVCGDPLVYARALSGLEELRPPARLAMALSGGPLLCRIRRIVGQPRTGDVIGGWLAGLLAIILPLALGGTWAWGRVDRAGGEPAAATQAAAPEIREPEKPAVADTAGDESIASPPASSENPPSAGANSTSTRFDGDSGRGDPAGPGMIWQGGPPTVRFLVPQRHGFNGTPDDLLPRMLEEHGPQRVVQVVVTGVPADAFNHVYDHLWRLLPNLSYFGTGAGDTVTVHLAPIDDLEAFAGRIDLGEVRSVDREKRLISIVADRSRLARPQVLPVAETADGADLETLCRRLTEQDWTAIEGLVAFGSEAEPAVAPYVEHEERRVRRAALLVLKRVATDASLPVLLTALADDDLGNRDLAWQAICRVPGLARRQEVIEAAVAALARQGEQAAGWLTTIGPSVETFVRPSLRHDDPRVRLAAVSVLAQVGTAKSLPALEALADDEVEEVARAAAKARAAAARR